MFFDESFYLPCFCLKQILSLGTTQQVIFGFHDKAWQLPLGGGGLSWCKPRGSCYQMWQPTSVWWRPEGSRPSGQNPDGDSLHPKY